MHTNSDEPALPLNPNIIVRLKPNSV